jgi:hypothetical protein
MGYLTREEAYNKGLQDDDFVQVRLNVIGDYAVNPDDQEDVMDFDLGELSIGEITISSALHWPIPSPGKIKDVKEYYIGKTHTVILEFYENEDGRISSNRDPSITEKYEPHQMYQVNGFLERGIEKKDKSDLTISILRVPFPIVVRIPNDIFKVNERYTLEGIFFSTLIGNQNDPFYEHHIMFRDSRFIRSDHKGW